ncbi:MAG: cytochrome oxidase maturation protein, cbb3-type [Desulfobulbaceae bacterium A2]|nr:MAG: cytochrome oxidase maturation protein, cbb3-type [Desulfobulbaceae bacterium A2]
MLWSAVALIFFTLLLGLAAWFLFMWAVKSGQFDDIEGPKYRMMDDDDEAGPKPPAPAPPDAPVAASSTQPTKNTKKS